MRLKITISALLVAGATAVAAVVAFGGTSSSSTPAASMSDMAGMHMQGMNMHAAPAAGLTASDLRALLGQQFGEHAVLAMNATDAGYSGSPAFPKIAKALDANSVAISKSIGTVYGAAAAKTFLDGKFMWRDHIRFFVAYTTALAKGDKAGQAKAVANLKTYTQKFGAFLAGATGLPTSAVQSDLLGHVFELKAQLDDYASKNYAKATSDYTAAYDHMFMTADLVAGAIAKQKHLAN
jgi:hypothetical protein